MLADYHVHTEFSDDSDERNYQHLTGLELIDENGNVLRNQSINFYRK